MVGANPRRDGGQSSAEGSITSLVDNKVISEEKKSSTNFDEHIYISTTVTPFLSEVMYYR